MSSSKVFLGGALGAALVLTACAALDGLGSYSECSECGDAAAHPRDGAPSGSSEASSESGPPSEAGDDVGGDDAAPEGDALPPTGDDAGEGGAAMDAADAADAGGAIDGGPICPSPTDIDGGLLVYYPFEGDTLDHSGNENNGTATPGTDITFGAGKVGQGVTILSTGKGIQVGGAATLGASRTLCAWVDTQTGTTGGGLPLFVVGPMSSADLYDISTANPNTSCSASIVKDQLFIDHWGATCIHVSQAPPEAQWDFVCFSQNGGTTTFFMNGASSQASTSTPYANLLSTVTLGADHVLGTTTQVLFKGQIDEVSIWGAALSTGDMNEIYNGGTGCHLP